MGNFNVTDLSEYLFCPRKLFLKKVLGFKEPLNKSLIIGSIKHHTYNMVYKKYDSLISCTTKETKKEELKKDFLHLFYRSLAYAVKTNIKGLEVTRQDAFEIFQNLWPYFAEEADKMSKLVFDSAKNLNAYGLELAEKLPKVSAEHVLKSEELNLTGKADKVEITDEKIRVYEYKTGNAPKEGVWENHEIQLGAYILIAKEKFGEKASNEGVIDYIDVNKKRSVTLDNELENKIIKVIKSIKELCTNNLIPPILENNAKCNNCGLREKCFSLQLQNS